MEGISKYHPAEPAGSASTTSSGTPSLPCRATIFIPSNPTAQETEMGPSIPYLPSYDRETNGTTFSYKNTRFSYADGPTPATTMGPRQQASRSGPAPRWDTSFPYLRESGLPRSETFYLHFSATAQLWRKDNYTRNSRLPRYKNIISSYDRSRVPATRQPPPAPPLSYGPLHVLSCIPPSRCACPPPLSLSCPFHIQPFPYPERLCIMTPYPPQQQERTPL